MRKLTPRCSTHFPVELECPDSVFAVCRASLVLPSGRYLVRRPLLRILRFWEHTPPFNMLLRALETLGVAFASAASVSSTPIAPQSHHRHVARQLLGTNFGVPNENGTFDYVIVGGGNAGLTLAARLSEDPGVTVVVVEAGNFYELTNGNLSQLPADDVSWSAKSIKEINPLVDWGFTTTPQPVSSRFGNRG